MDRRAAALVAAWMAIGAGHAAASEPPITVTGNRRIEADTIRSYFHTSGALDAGHLDAALKALYATGLFQDVKIERRDGRIVVIVVENPVINRVSFEGNRKIKEDQLKKEVQSQERGPLSRATVQSDVERMVELYRRMGRFDAEVAPKIISRVKAASIWCSRSRKASASASARFCSPATPPIRPPRSRARSRPARRIC